MKAVRIGGKLRRMRQERRLTQTQMAAELGVSPSYLNLLESNQRPVTVRVLLRLAERFQLDLGDLATEDTERLTSNVMEVFSDPLFDSADIKTSDVKDLVTSLPSVARGILDLYDAYRNHHPASLSNGLQNSVDGSVRAEEASFTLPSEEVTEFLHKNQNHFPTLEEAAENIWLEHKISLHTLTQDLVELLLHRFAVDVDVARCETMPDELRRYNPMTRKLEISELLPLPSRTFQLAHQLAFLAIRPKLDAIVASYKFNLKESEALARSALANYFASSMMMPYARFMQACRSTRYDIQVLQHRFGVSFEQTCHRLTTLSRKGDEGVPFHLIRVDIAGNISKRYSASGIQIARFGAACPRWNVYDAFATPGMLRVQVSRMPDGQTFFCVARTVRPAGRSTMRGGLSHRLGQLAIGLGCSIVHARELIYSDGLNLDDPQIITPIGVSCRTCSRDNCSERAMPSLNQHLDLDENSRGLSTYSRPLRQVV